MVIGFIKRKSDGKISIEAVKKFIVVLAAFLLGILSYSFIAVLLRLFEESPNTF